MPSFSSRRQRPQPRRRPQIELLEDRLAPARLSLLGGTALYTAATNKVNDLQIAYDAASQRYTFTDPGDVITFVPGQLQGGRRDSLFQVSVPATTVASIQVDVGDRDDTVRILSALDRVTVAGGTGSDSYFVGGGDLTSNLFPVFIQDPERDTRVTVQDAQSRGTHVYTVSPGSVSRDGFGGVFFSPNVASLDLAAGRGTVNVPGTSPETATTITLSDDATTVNVGGINSLDSIRGSLTVSGGAAGVPTRGAVNFLDHGDPGAHKYTVEDFLHRTGDDGEVRVAFPGIARIRVRGSAGGNHFDVPGSPVGSALTLELGAGADTARAGTDGRLDRIRTAVTIDGGGNPIGTSDRVVLVDQAQAAAREYEVTGGAVRRDAAVLVSYSGVELLEVYAGTAADAFRVVTTAPGTAYVLEGGPGADRARLGVATGVLAHVAGAVTFRGGDGADTAALFDQSNPLATTVPLNWNVGPDTIARVDFGGLATDSVESREITAGLGRDSFTVRGTTAGTVTTVRSGPGDDHFQVGNGDASLGVLQGELVLDGGTGLNTLELTDAAGAAGRHYRLEYLNPGSLTVPDLRLAIDNQERLRATAVAAERMTTTDFADVVQILGTGSPFTLHAGGGDDNVTAGDATHPLGAGFLTFDAGPGLDTLNLDDSANAVRREYTLAGDGRFWFDAAPRFQFLSSETLNFTAGSGDDLLDVTGVPQGTLPTVNGGPGNDTMTGSNAVNYFVLLGLNQGISNAHAFHSFENLLGGDSPANRDYFILTNGIDAGVSGWIDGTGGANTLAYTQLLTNLSYADYRGDVMANLLLGSATAIGGGALDRVRNIHHAIGAAGNDVLVGNAPANKLEGRGGSDVVIGRGGADTLEGGGGVDLLIGGGTAFDGDGALLGLIQAAWAKELPLSERVAGLWELLDRDDVSDDRTEDDLTGGNESDLFWFGVDDRTRDFVADLTSVNSPLATPPTGLEALPGVDLPTLGSTAPAGFDMLVDGTPLISEGTPFTVHGSPGPLQPPPAGDPLPPPFVGPWERFRIGTFNAQYLVDPVRSSVAFDFMSVEERVTLLAERIIAADYDVIVLNEMFDGDAQERLAELLGQGDDALYPYYVSYLDDHETIDPFGDSGLMLFSRFEFLPLIGDLYRARDFHAYSAGSEWNDVAFVPFHASSGTDSFANKGAGYVRIRNPYSGRPYHVVFTHLDADEEGGDLSDDVEARLMQLGEIGDMIKATVPAEVLAREDLFILGDLNINGDLTVFPIEDWILPTAFGLHDVNLVDAWKWETYFDELDVDDPSDPEPVPAAQRDRGLTSDPQMPWGTRKRLDFIFHNKPNSPDRPPLDFQHMTLSYNLYHQGQPLSDHLGVTADLNVLVPHGSTEDPFRIDTDDFDAYTSTATFGTNAYHIAYPGGVQWFEILDPGTYAFDVQGVGMRLEVYDSTDLSRPLRSYFDETVIFSDAASGIHEGVKYHLAGGRFFVKVWNNEPSWTGEYRLDVHRNTGASPGGAIVLFPNEPLHVLLNSASPVWFQIDTDMPFTGGPQALRFFADGLEPFTLELIAADGTLVAMDGPGLPVIERYDAAHNGVRLYLKVTPVVAGTRLVYVGWETNLTIFRALGIQAERVTDDFLFVGIDTNVRLQFQVDSFPGGPTVFAEAARPNLGHFNTFNNRTLTEAVPFTIGMLWGMLAELEEDDTFEVGSEGGENDFLQGAILPLGPTQVSSLGNVAIIQELDGEAWYRIYYDLHRGTHRLGRS